MIGYDPRRVTDLCRSREFAAELRNALDDRLRIDLAPKAVAALDQMITDEKLSPKVRLDVAKAILDRSGHGALEAGRTQGPEGDVMDSWSIDRLQKFISDFEEKLKEEEAKRAEVATDVTPSPVEELLEN
ncbi:hypothetical protein [Aestuariivirga sp.]|uniref:hypothetical protein n=1 Tax=Aestuariivirga sp. TaxID=2650926 RepID=UPI0039E2D686